MDMFLFEFDYIYVRKTTAKLFIHCINYKYTWSYFCYCKTYFVHSSGLCIGIWTVCLYKEPFCHLYICERVAVWVARRRPQWCLGWHSSRGVGPAAPWLMTPAGGTYHDMQMCPLNTSIAYFLLCIRLTMAFIRN